MFDSAWHDLAPRMAFMTTRPQIEHIDGCCLWKPDIWIKLSEDVVLVDLDIFFLFLLKRKERKDNERQRLKKNIFFLFLMKKKRQNERQRLKKNVWLIEKEKHNLYLDRHHLLGLLDDLRWPLAPTQVLNSHNHMYHDRKFQQYRNKRRICSGFLRPH